MSDDPRVETSAQHLVYFAAERTLLTWIRTSLGLIALGFVIDRFGLFLWEMAPESHPGMHPRGFSMWAGSGIVLLGVLMNVVAAIRYWRFADRYRREGNTDPGYGLSVAIVFTILVAIAGIVVAAFLLSLTE